MKILIAEDEMYMQKIIRLYLEKEGYEVSLAQNGKDALSMLQDNSFDLLVSDWMMPQMDGLELCKEVRKLNIPIKIIMLTAKSTNMDEIDALKHGADDYIKKPFEPQILLLRIEKMFAKQNILSCGKIKLYLDNKIVKLNDEIIKTTHKEWLLLEHLMKNKGKPLTRDYLIETIWGYEYEGDERTLDTHIRRLRKKIGNKYITTFVGIGYKIDEIKE